MKKVAIVTDSIACLTREVEQYVIEILPINFYSDGEVYEDFGRYTPVSSP